MYRQNGNRKQYISTVHECSMWKSKNILVIACVIFNGWVNAQTEYDAEKYSKYDTLATHYQKEIAACSACADTTIGRLYLDQVQAYLNDSRSIEAYAALEKAKEHLEKTNHPTLLAEMNISYAEYFRIAAQYTKAIGYLENAWELIGSGEVGKRTLARYYSRKAAVAVEYELDLEGSIRYSEECLRLAREINDNALIATALNEIGYAQYNMGDTAALENYLTAYRLMIGENRLMDACNMLSNYVHFLVVRKEFDRATDEALLGYQMAVENNFDRSIFLFADHLMHIYRHKGDYKQALFYHQKKYDMHEKLNRQIWGRTVSELEKKYDLQHKEEQLELNQLKIDNQELELRKEKAYRNTFIFFLVLTAGLLGIVVYSFSRTRRDNRKLEGLLKENQFLLGESNHRIKNNLQLISALTYQELKKKHPKEDENNLLAISAKIEAISTLHKQLYLTESKETIRIDTYLEGIKDNFLVLLQKRNIRMDFEVEPVELSIHTSTYIGLLCTELILNSLKHAFNGDMEMPHIHVVLRMEKGKVFFSYSDNGSGMADKNKKLQLIDLISRQLRFDYLLNNERGFYFETANLA